MVELVNEFLNLRKLQEGKMEYSFEPTDIAEMVSQVVAGLQQLAEHKHLRLSFENHATRTLCSVDRQKFSQVIQNLVDNAVKYTDTGEVRVRIQDEANGMVNILVSDTGHGIDPAIIDKLFEQFARDQKDAVKIEGTGLGLYIAKQIMDAHHGRVWAISPGVGKGSTFFVQLKTISS
jgi:signal transduction histidine kinase